jgi:hypothetical protein
LYYLRKLFIFATDFFATENGKQANLTAFIFNSKLLYSADNQGYIIKVAILNDRIFLQNMW